MAGPSTVEQLVLVALFVLPGVSFQLIRELSRGLIPGERDLGERVLRPFVTSVVILAVYGTCAGQALLEFLLPVNGVWFAHAFAHANQAAFLGLVLLVIVPAIVAWFLNHRDHKIGASRQSTFPGQSAWQRAFAHRKDGLVRIQLKNGKWVGGWYDDRSYASGHPGQTELYLAIEYDMEPDGTFGVRSERTGGVYLNLMDADYVEFVMPPPKPANTRKVFA